MEKPLSKEYLQKILAAYQKAGKSQRQAARLLKMCKTTYCQHFRRAMKELKGKDLKAVPTISIEEKKRTGSGLTRSQFAAEFDYTQRLRLAIRSGCKSLTDDDGIMTDSQFRMDRCGNIGLPGWRTILEEQEFAKYRFACGNKIWWASPANVKWALSSIPKAKEL